MKSQTVAWSDAYALGLPEIDMQHEWLFALINRLWQQVVGQPNRTEALKVLADLERYAATHFSAEEEFMRATEYPRFAEHREAHREFVRRVADEQAALRDGGHLTLDLVEFLRDWLVDHILRADKAYARNYEKRNRPASLLARFFRRFA